MRLAFTLLLLVLTASAAWAVVDPDADQMGLYFDPTGDTVCITVAPATTFPLYVLYTNPSLAEVRGFECKITKSGAGAGLAFLVDTEYPVDGMNISAHSGDDYHFIVGYAEPVPTTAATVLATLRFMTIETDPVEMRLGPAEPASLGSSLPVVLAGDYSLLPTGLSAPQGPAALINAPDCAVVDNDPTPWGAIKAMYHTDADGEVSR